MNERQKGIAFIVLATVAWSFPALAIKYLTGYMDLYTQNLVRFTSASAMLWAVCLIRSRREALAGAKELLRVLPAAAAAFAYQYCWVTAFYMRSVLPGMAYLLIKSTVIMTAVLSFAFFRDERSVIRDRRFVIGGALSLIGLSVFVLAAYKADPGQASAAGGTLVWGVLLILVSCFFWSLYTVLVKLLVRRGSPLVTYTYVCTLMTFAFAALTALKGEPVNVPGGLEGAWVWTVAVGSGALCVGAAHVLYYYGIRILGTTVCGTVSLTNTFVPPLLSAFIFDERLLAGHIAAGVVLVIGAAFTLQARPKEERPAA